MHADYMDIRSRISEPPRWFDSHGVPRYDDFTPELCPNIYADEVILMEIACQACHENFLVELHSDLMSRIYPPPAGGLLCRPKFSESIKPGDIPHYGDPPRHSFEHSCAGDTMNCWDLRIVEFWERISFTEQRENGFLSRWRRRQDLEVAGDELPDD
jgi:hypothetical protein